MSDVDERRRSGIGCFGILGVMLATVLVTVVVTIWVINSQLFGSRFIPVMLSQEEQTALTQKLDAIGLGGLNGDEGDLTPEPYEENTARRRIALSERELNALVSRNTDAAERLVIDLSEDLLSAKLRLPMDPDFPFIGGKILKASAGLSLSYERGQPRVVVRGLSVWGIPIPNAWLGNIKNIDLVEEFGADQGFWQSFAQGIENIEVKDQALLIQLTQ